MEDEDDWRTHVARANALIQQRRPHEAIPLARQAVALAPDEPDARLALADALLAVWPRRTSCVAAAFAEVDEAELLGVDAEDLAVRRSKSKGFGLYVVAWTTFALFTLYGINGNGGAIGRAIAWPGMFAFFCVTPIVTARLGGQRFGHRMKTRRRIHRKRLATDAQVSQRAPAAAAVFTFLVLPSAGTLPPVIDGDAAWLWLFWLMLGGIPLAGAAAWIGIDRWLRPGTVLRTLRHDAFVADSVCVTFVLAMTAPALVLGGVRSSGILFSLFLLDLAWLAIGGLSGAKVSSHRKKAAIDPA
ncbi:Tetratricopeptide TPR_2 repeat protein [Catenulispora acidiphila DSM 44928]|uniref:Tetratricopeptide TPR_2 repeat protein n=1 Tax=Catenulispora acidiphila (strain DSM 44928 / JCM 14897 / NBRC 102108 / NRRL B-24433 / ID139908) TaxID=479433 RepID=C7PXI5_CATAD|nr:tetratricopeptide repeat protein [Catenulispora acidiphila]ACU71438.1 Tetratricopeptide TPR_2 repeat protein [Catenulispora acidiphila DSM 44928]